MSKESQSIYCAVPKVGTSSWVHTLLKLSGRSLSGLGYVHKRKHSDEIVKRGVHFSSKKRRLLLQKYYKFMFVREPLERLISAYQATMIRPVRKTPKMAKIEKVIKMRRKFLNNTYRG